MELSGQKTCIECGQPISNPLKEAFEELREIYSTVDRRIELFEINGQNVFVVYGESGGPTCRLVSYLVRKKPGTLAEKFGFWVTIDNAIHYREELVTALLNFQEHCTKVDLDGGDMGLPPLP